MPAFPSWRTLRDRLLLVLGISAFFGIMYFGLSKLPIFSPRMVTWDPVWYVPYISAFVPVYCSAYPMPGVILFAPFSPKEFRRLIAAYAVAILISAPVFVLLPLVPPRVVLGNGFLDDVMAWTYQTDVFGNCFPSLHVSLALLTAHAIGRCLPRLKIPMLIWAGLVAVSTVFVHQHYVVDVIGGILVAAIAWRVTRSKSSKTAST